MRKLTLAILALVLVPGAILAGDYIIWKWTSQVAATIETTQGDGESVDLRTVSGLSASAWNTQAIAGGQYVYRLSVLDNDTTATIRVNTSDTIQDLTGASAALTGLTLTERESIYFRPTGRYLNIYGAVGSANVTVVRVGQ